jgi:acyl-homoserine lactone acylase PvdQ
MNKLVDDLKILPLEFKATGANFEPWQVSDSVLVTKFMQWLTTQDAHSEILRDYLSFALEDEELIERLLPYQDKHFTPTDAFIINDEELKSIGKFKPFEPCSDCQTKRVKHREWYKALLDLDETDFGQSAI